MRKIGATRMDEWLVDRLDDESPYELVLKKMRGFVEQELCRTGKLDDQGDVMMPLEDQDEWSWGGTEKSWGGTDD